MQSSNFTNPDIHTNVSVGSLELHLMNFLEYRIFRRNGEMPACKRNRNMMYFPAAHRKKSPPNIFHSLKSETLNSPTSVWNFWSRNW